MATFFLGYLIIYFFKERMRKNSHKKTNHMVEMFSNIRRFQNTLHSFLLSLFLKITFLCYRRQTLICLVLRIDEISDVHLCIIRGLIS